MVAQLHAQQNQHLLSVKFLEGTLLVLQEENSMVVLADPDGRAHKVLGYITASRRCGAFVSNARVFRGAELSNIACSWGVGSVKLKLKYSLLAQNVPPLDSSRLKDPTSALSYKCSLSNKLTL